LNILYILWYLLSFTEYSSAETSNSSIDGEPAGKGKVKVSVSNIPKLVDNKRRHMEKSLSQAQRDRLLMSTAKEDLLMKKDMLEAFQGPTKHWMTQSQK